MRRFRRCMLFNIVITWARLFMLDSAFGGLVYHLTMLISNLPMVLTYHYIAITGNGYCSALTAHVEKQSVFLTSDIPFDVRMYRSKFPRSACIHPEFECLQSCTCAWNPRSLLGPE